MDRSVHRERFGEFIDQFHDNNNLTIVPCHGFETWDPTGDVSKELVHQHDNYIRDVAVIPVYNTGGIRNEIKLQDTITTLTDLLLE